MARKVTYEDLKRLQEGQAALQEGQAALAEGQSALAAKVSELKAEIKTELKTMMELMVLKFQLAIESQKQIQVQELEEMKDHIQHELADMTVQLWNSRGQQAKETAEIKEQFQQFNSDVKH